MKLLLDLFCGGGGAGMGYFQAGYEVIGVDNINQPDYPFQFIRAEAMQYLHNNWDDFDAIHASPPCKASSTLNKGTNAEVTDHVDLVPVVRRALAALPLPTVVENVKSASLRPDLTLCGTMFGLQVFRHRFFELSFACPRPLHPKHQGRIDGWRHGRWIHGSYRGVYGDGGGKGDVKDWQEALGIAWITTKKSLADAIPPAYTHHIGDAMLVA